MNADVSNARIKLWIRRLLKARQDEREIRRNVAKAEGILRKLDQEHRKRAAGRRRRARV